MKGDEAISVGRGKQPYERYQPPGAWYVSLVSADA